MVQSPLRETQPEVGCCKPTSTFSMVDFPAPFLPTRPMRSFGLIRKEISLNRSHPPKLTVRLSTEIMDVCYAFLLANACLKTGRGSDVKQFVNGVGRIF